MTEPIIEFSDFSFKYNSQAEANLTNVKLAVHPGEKLLILGPSGSGKSTLAKCINGLIPEEDPGDITGTGQIAGHPVGGMSLFDLSFSVSTVLQDPDSQFTGLTAAEDIAFMLENDAMPQAQMKQVVAEWANRLQIKGLLNQSPQSLSGGQKQKVSLAGVLVNQAPILLLDEPLANLDPVASHEILALVTKLQAELGFTLVMIEHRLDLVSSAAFDHAIVLSEGRVVSDSDLDTLLKTERLEENGIEPPLYVRVLKAAGIDVQRQPHLDHVQQLELTPAELGQIRRWSEGAVQQAHSKPEGSALLELQNVGFQYPNKNHATLAGVNCTIYQGDFISVVGQNGAGKSTLMKLICGFLRGTGTITWQDKSLATASIKEIADHIGYVMQDPNQMLSQKTVFAEVALGLRLRQVEHIETQVNDVLQICGLYPFRNWPLSALSFGQRKRVTIAAILVLHPQLLILDEPTAGQDWQTYTEIMTFLEQLHQQGITIMLITHDLELMAQYSNRVLVVNDGKLAADVTPNQLLQQPELMNAAHLCSTSLATLAKQAGTTEAELMMALKERGKQHE
ncbi:ABC transporter ATP-binding protein [Fructilactobacillus carniphilus]|uniref:ABC transporter ATP-binding protein n=1 Tax=Fructilactobacillus carniphilus TaxID=2940297 RepID=A0ABY5BUP5_9LACO|nr:ABC transporter ATP-binding protein [Fructilactobacillus carniphilus]USS90229.1 ABC transporter ATP-binding protein [Fructilactobacillus carniphilus]